MCGRAMLTVSADDLEQTFGYRAPRGYGPRYNIAPSQPLLTLFDGREGFGEMVWGMAASGTSTDRKIINLRAEGFGRGGAHAPAGADGTCLIIVNGYYEWRKADDRKHPHHIHLAGDKAFTLAGVYDGEGGEGGCAVVTRPACELTKHIHGRMPLIIPRGSRESWLAGEFSSKRSADLLSLEPSRLLEREVSSYVNSAANEDERCLWGPDAEAPPSRASKPDGRRASHRISSMNLDLFGDN